MGYITLYAVESKLASLKLSGCMGNFKFMYHKYKWVKVLDLVTRWR